MAEHAHGQHSVMISALGATNPKSAGAGLHTKMRRKQRLPVGICAGRSHCEPQQLCHSGEGQPKPLLVLGSSGNTVVGSEGALQEKLAAPDCCPDSTAISMLDNEQNAVSSEGALWKTGSAQLQLRCYTNSNNLWAVMEQCRRLAAPCCCGDDAKQKKQ
eukprot:1160914-Pelagomonas_calceolata.AAC.19